MNREMLPGTPSAAFTPWRLPTNTSDDDARNATQAGSASRLLSMPATGTKGAPVPATEKMRTPDQRSSATYGPGGVSVTSSMNGLPPMPAPSAPTWSIPSTSDPSLSTAASTRRLPSDPPSAEPNPASVPDDEEPQALAQANTNPAETRVRIRTLGS